MYTASVDIENALWKATVTRVESHVTKAQGVCSRAENSANIKMMMMMIIIMNPTHFEQSVWMLHAVQFYTLWIMLYSPLTFLCHIQSRCGTTHSPSVVTGGCFTVRQLKMCECLRQREGSMGEIKLDDTVVEWSHRYGYAGIVLSLTLWQHPPTPSSPPSSPEKKRRKKE